jgi:hypothetical protein
VIARDARPGERHELRVNAFTFFDRPLTGFGAELLVRDERIERLYHDLATPFEVARRLHQTDAQPPRHPVTRRDRAGAPSTVGSRVRPRARRLAARWPRPSRLEISLADSERADDLGGGAHPPRRGCGCGAYMHTSGHRPGRSCFRAPRC